MMCNLLGQREIALGNHIPALQLFKQAEQVYFHLALSILNFGCLGSNDSIGSCDCPRLVV